MEQNNNKAEPAIKQLLSHSRQVQEWLNQAGGRTFTAHLKELQQQAQVELAKEVRAGRGVEAALLQGKLDAFEYILSLEQRCKDYIERTAPKLVSGMK